MSDEKETPQPFKVPSLRLQDETATPPNSSVTDTVEQVLDEDEHSDNRYGNGLEIIKYSGITRTIIWALVIAALSGVTGYFFAPQPAWILLTVFGFFAGGLAAIDLKTHIIKNKHTLLTAIVTVPVGVFVASQLGWWNLLGGVVSAVITMGVLLLLVIFVNFGSGGDLKFSPIPGFVMGVISPMLAVLWFFLSMVATVVLMAILKKKQVAFGAGMAIAVPIAVVVTYLCFNLVGLPYL